MEEALVAMEPAEVQELKRMEGMVEVGAGCGPGGYVVGGFGGGGGGGAGDAAVVVADSVGGGAEAAKGVGDTRFLYTVVVETGFSLSSM